MTHDQAEALRGLVRAAYSEAFQEGINDVQTSRGGRSWHESNTKRRLDELAALASPAPAGGEVLREAVAGLLPWLEDAETKCLVGDEGCVWAVEQLRHALDAATPPPSPDVAGVVERLREALTVLDGPFHHNAIAQAMEEAATLLESLSADKGRLVEALERVSDATPQSTNTVSAEGAFSYVRAVARAALAPKEKA